MPIPIVAFFFEELLLALVWGALLLLTIWVWQKTKAQGNLLMMIGAAVLTLAAVLFAFTGSETIPGFGTIKAFPGSFVMFWMPFIGAILLLVGYYFTVKAMVDSHIEALKKKLHDVAGEKKTEGGESGGD